MEKIVTKTTLRYYQDAEFRAKVHRVVQIMEADKQARLTESELAIICLASGLTIVLAEEE